MVDDDPTAVEVHTNTNPLGAVLLSDTPARGSVNVPLEVSRNVRNQERFDHEYGYVEYDDSWHIAQAVKQKLKCSQSRAWSMLIGFLPIIDWLPKYNMKQDLAPDFIAGLTVGVMHIPQGMAYAGLAGLDPVYGLYTSFFPSLFYMFVGTSRHVSLGVFAVVSLMVGTVRYELVPDTEVSDSALMNSTIGTIISRTITVQSVPSTSTLVSAVTDQQLTPIEAVTALTLAVGIVQIIMGMLRLGFITSYLSDQVVSGFTTGAAIHVFTAQINKILNVNLPRPAAGPGKIFKIYAALFNTMDKASYISVLVSLGTIVMLVIGKEFINPPVKKRFSIPIPWELVAVILGTVISHFCQFYENYGLQIVHEIPTGLPMPRIPPVQIIPSILVESISIALVVFVITISLGKMFAKKHHYKIDPDQEPYAYGVINILTSLFSGHVVCASLTRSSVMSEMDGRSEECFALGSMQLFSCLFGCYPASTALARSMVYEGAGVKTQCVLASIIVVALKGMFMQFKQLKHLWPVSKVDFFIWIVSFVATVVLDVRDGLLVGLVCALCTSIARSQWPPAVLLGKLPNTEIYRDVKRYKSIETLPGICVFRFDSPLMFTNCDAFRERLYAKCGISLAAARKAIANTQQSIKLKNEIVDKDTPKSVPVPARRESDGVLISNDSPPSPLLELRLPQFIILDCSGFNYVDYMGVNTLIEIYGELKEISVRLLYASLKAPCRDVMCAAKFYSKVPKSQLFPTVHCAVVYAQAQQNTRRLKMTDLSVNRLFQEEEGFDGTETAVEDEPSEVFVK